MNSQPIVVVGGGAAGAFAALAAARLGAPVILLEKTDRLGTKILISGGGKCNVAHDGRLEDVIRAFRPEEARFLRPACYRMPNDEIIAFFRDRGLEVYTRPDGRVFPVHQSAKDVVAIIERELAEQGVEVRFHAEVGAVVRGENGFTLTVGSEQLSTRHLVVTTGGCSYPKTGSTGDGWRWAKQLGHSTEPIFAALAPIELAGAACTQWAGVALRDVKLIALQGGKPLDSWRGDLLFTHRGVSGPCALGISRTIAENGAKGEVTLAVDLIPERPVDAMQADFRALKERQPNEKVERLVEGLVPQRLVEALCADAGLEAGARLQTCANKQIFLLAEAVKTWRLGKVSHVPVDRGEVVAGGVSREEADPQTMRSTLVEGLYWAGEVLDVAGPVGGYNLQAAFATGHVAGESAAQDWLNENGQS